MTVYRKSFGADWGYHLCFDTVSTALRVKILDVLEHNSSLPVSDIARHVDEERSAVSHALLSLKACHLLISEKRGKQVYYSINPQSWVHVNSSANFSFSSSDSSSSVLKVLDAHIVKHCSSCVKFSKSRGR